MRRLKGVYIMLLLIIPVILLSASVIGARSDSNEIEDEHGNWVMINSESCTICHKEVTISVKEMATLGCSSCHNGNPNSTAIELAHRDLITDPLNRSLLSKTCGQCHKLSDGDVREFIYENKKMHPSTGRLVLPDNLTVKGGGESCLDCHGDIEISISGMKNLTCTTCHGGDPSSFEKDAAHSGLVRDPLAPGVADKICGQCHSRSIYEKGIVIHSGSPQQSTTTITSPNETLTRTEPPSVDGNVLDGEYNARFDFGRITIYTRTEGNLVYIALIGKTAGWVAIGFGASDMKGADIVIGWVSGGKTYVLDSYSTGKTGPHRPDTILGGSDDIIEYAGSEVNGITTIEFVRKLVTGDPYDKPIRIGTNTVIWAVGDSDNPKDIHVERGKSTIILREVTNPTMPNGSVTGTSGGNVVTPEIVAHTKTETSFTEVREQTRTVTEIKTITATSTSTVETLTWGREIAHLMNLLGIPIAIVVAMVLIALKGDRS